MDGIAYLKNMKQGTIDGTKSSLKAIIFIAAYVYLMQVLCQTMKQKETIILVVMVAYGYLAYRLWSFA